MILRFLGCICLVLLVVLQAPAQNPDVTRIAFGSCNNQAQPQPLWPDIINAQPDLWVWLGDNIYADTDDMQLMQQYYQQQLQQPGYRQLLQTCPITGIWSDHDYAGDNANKLFPYKKQSQQLFLDFMGIPQDAAIRKQEGIYRTYTLGEDDQKIKIILLDGMYHSDPYKELMGLYLPNGSGDMLGEAQWAWLEQELTNTDASMHIIASGLQVLPHTMSYTTWAAFPASRERLLRLLEKTKPAIPIILSGDRHVGELGKYELQGYTYPLYELTSSGMTHFREAKPGGNRYRVGEQVGALNYGLLQINWADDATIVTMQIRGENGKVYLQEVYSYPTSFPTRASRQD